MMAVGARSAIHMATALLPAAVGPQMTRISAPAESALNLVPTELNDRGAAVHVVRGQRRVAERDKQRAHLAGGERVSRLHRRFARDGCRESLVARVRCRLAV